MRTLIAVWSLVLPFVVTLISGSIAANADTFQLDYGRTSTSGEQISIVRIPVIKKDGSIIYRDLTLKLRLLPNGKFAVVSGFPKTTATPPLLSEPLTAGFYKNDDGRVHQLIGPAIGPDNRELWTLTGHNLDYTSLIEFYTGPVTGHPLEERLRKLKVDNSTFVFGRSSGALGDYEYRYFQNDGIASIIAIGKDIQIRSHTQYGKDDRALPWITLMFHRCEDSDCD